MIARTDSPQVPSAAAHVFWIAILALAGLGGSLVVSCVTPFVALAVVLAGTVRLTIALPAMTAIWLLNQFVGFAFLNFPRTPNSILWGVATGMAALVATVIASRLTQSAQPRSTLARLGFALLSSFAVYEATHFVAALFLGGLETFAPAIVGQIGLVNLAWFAGLILLNKLVAIVCKPWIGLTPRLATAR